MKVLVINCGSSSLKFQLIDGETESVLVKGLCERIGLQGSRFVYQPKGCEKMVREIDMPEHETAVGVVLHALTDQETGVISSLAEVSAVGHRVVHGGEKFAEAVRITPEVMEAIEECNDLAPLHNPANLIGIRACQAYMQDVPMVAVFDTAFHQTMPPKAYLYGVPYAYYTEHKVRRYGFHGTSHDYVSQRTAEILGTSRDELKTIVCHLGNGASISAVCHGKSVDTSMGLTPLEGVVMGTRSGSLDPAILEYICKKEHMSLEEAMQILNKKSGVQGLSGISSDFRDILSEMEKGNPQAILTMDVYCYNVAKYVGAYVAAMNGVDAIAFTAGVGENNPVIRQKVCAYFGYLGVALDDEQNENSRDDAVISKAESKVAVLVVATNEELKIARETMAKTVAE